MIKLNPILHQELRLSLMSFLMTVSKADFKKLLEVTGASKGNISVQLSKLEDAGFIKINKSFKGKYPHTDYKVTAKGKKEFNIYLIQLKEMLNI